MVNGAATIGDDCIIRQNVTFGAGADTRVIVHSLAEW